MNNYNITFSKISTLEVNIVNTNPLSGEHLQLNLNRNIRAREDSSFLCILTVSICRKADIDKPDKDFLIKCSISAIAKCDNPDSTAEDVQNVITKELYPHIRAIISSIMGAAGIEPILLPTLIN